MFETPPASSVSCLPVPVPSSHRDKHVLFVCTGNICRSPMAEGLLRHALNGQSEPLRSIPVYSAGTQAFDGDPASANGVQAMHDAGIDISAHRSRSVTEKLMENAIVVFVMTHQHMDDLRYYYPDSKTPVYRMREFVSNKARSDISLDVHDPYGMGLGDYKECRDSMVEAIPGILTFLKELLSQ